MPRRANRLKGIFVVIVSIFLAITVCGIFYYFKIKQNENYQNQLHFRQLKDINVSFNNGISQLQSYINSVNQLSKKTQPLKKTISQIDDFSIKANEYFVSNKKLSRALNNKQIKLDRLNNKIINRNNYEAKITTEMKQSGKLIVSSEKELKQLINKVIQQEKLVDNIELDLEQKFISLFDIPQNSKAFDLNNCYANDPHCLWLINIFDVIDELFSFDESTSFDEQIKINNEVFNQIQALIKSSTISKEGFYLQTLSQIENEMHENTTKQNTIDQFKVWLDKANKQSDKKFLKAWLIEGKQFIKNESKNFFEQKINEYVSGFEKVITAEVDAKKEKKRSKAQSQSLPPNSNFVVEIENTILSLAYLKSSLEDRYNNLKSKKEIFEIIKSNLDTNTPLIKVTSESLIKAKQNLVSLEYQANENSFLIDQNKRKINNLTSNTIGDISDEDSSFKKNLEIDITALIESLVVQDKALQLGVNAEVDALNKLLNEVQNNKLIYLLKNKNNRDLIESYTNYISCIKRLTSIDDGCFNTSKNTLIEKLKVVLQSFSIKSAPRRWLSSQGTALKNLKYDPFKVTSKKALFDKEKKDSLEILLDKGTSKMKVAINTGWYRAPIVDFLGDVNKTYPLVLLVDNKGNSIAVLKNEKINASLSGITFGQINSFLDKLVKNQNDKRVGFSGYIDTEISGRTYRLFISPLSRDNKGVSYVNDKKGEIEQLYLVGFREKSNLLASKLSISRSIVVVAILVILGLVGLIPLLKIRLVSIHQSFSHSDRHLLVIGMIVLVTVLTIGFFDYLHYAEIKSDIKNKSNAIFIEIRNKFKKEVDLLANKASSLITQNDDLRFTPEDRLFPKGNYQTLNNEGVFLENLFFLEGRQSLAESAKLKGLAFWSKDSTFRNGEEISVLHRDYAIKALEGDLWPVKFEFPINYCSENGLYIDRIFNIRDSRLTTQLSMSCDFSLVEKQGSQSVSHAERYHDAIAFGTKLQTFFAAVLPENFGFVVYDNKLGNVLYHSDDKTRSLVENFYVETDNNPLITASSNVPFLYDQPINFDAMYRGKMQHFSLGDLYNGIPWKLAIFYDKEEIRSVNLISIFIALSLSLFSFILVYLAVTFIPKNIRRVGFWSASFSQNSRKEVIIRSLKWIFVITLSIVFITWCIYSSVTQHHHSRYQQINQAKLAAKIFMAKKNKEQYLKIILDKNSVFSSEQNKEVNCYLGMRDSKVEQPCFSTKNNKALDSTININVTFFNSVIEYFWNYINLKTNIDDEFLVTKKLDLVTSGDKLEEDKNIIDSSLNLYSMPITKSNEEERSGAFLLFLLLTILASPIFYVLIKWILVRLLGVNHLVYFRQNQKNSLGLLACLKHGLCKQHQFSLIIRPSDEMQFDIFNSSKDYEGLNLVTSRIINLSSWIKADSQTEGNQDQTNEQTVKNILGKFWLQWSVKLPLSAKQTLTLEGIEAIASNPKQRSLVLSVLEELVQVSNLNILLFCEIAPLYMLTNQCEYPIKGVEDNQVCSSEVVRWANLLRKFNKIYEWNASEKSFGTNNKTPIETLYYEALGWPELNNIWLQFWQYHHVVNDIDITTQNIDIKEPCEQKNHESVIDENAKTGKVNKHWKKEQIIEFFGANAGAFYRYRWELCTKAERVLLFHIANDFEPNPLNKVPIEHLTRRGYIYRDCGWHIINDSFKQFILTAEPKKVMDEWLDEANESVWRYLRIPFFALLISLLAIMVYSATDAIESALGILTAILGIIPMALRNFSLFKGG